MLSLLNPYVLAVSGGGGSDLTSYFGGGADEGWWPTDDAATMASDEDGTGAVTDGNDVGYVENAGAGPNLLQSLSALRGHWDESQGTIKLSGNWNFDVALTTRSTDMYFAFAVKLETDDTFFSARPSDGSLYFGYCRNGSTGVADTVAGSVTYAVDGVELVSPNRDDLHTALAADSNSLKIFEMWGMDLTAAAWANTQFPVTLSDDGQFGDPLLIQNPGSTARAEIRTILGNRHGKSL